MKYKAKFTHVIREDGRPYNARTIRADIDIVESDEDLSNNKWPFYYQVDSVATPSISCQNNLVTITSKGADAIYYTIDGSAPGTGKTKYTAPFAITQTVTVKAVAYIGENYSSVATQQCTYVAPDTGSEVIG